MEMSILYKRVVVTAVFFNLSILFYTIADYFIYNFLQKHSIIFPFMFSILELFPQIITVNVIILEHVVK